MATFSEIFGNFIKDFKKAQMKLPLVDQFETGSNFSWALTRMGELCEEADRLNPQLVSAMAEERTAGVNEGKIAAQAEIKETHIPKAEHDTLVKTAAESAAKTAREEAAKDFDTRLAAIAERAKLATELALPAEVLAKIPDAALAPAQAEATRAKLTERVGRLTAINLTPADHADLFGAAAEALDPAGDAQFDTLVERMKKAQDAGKKAAVGAQAEAKDKNGNPMFARRKEGEPSGEFIRL